MRIINDVDDHDEHSHMTIVIPEFTTRRWGEALLHNQSAWRLKAELAQRPNTVTVSVPLRPRPIDADDDHAEGVRLVRSGSRRWSQRRPAAVRTSALSRPPVNARHALRTR